MQFVDQLIFRKAAPRQIKYLKPLDYTTASGLSAEVFRQLEENFVVGPQKAGNGAAQQRAPNER